MHPSPYRDNNPFEENDYYSQDLPAGPAQHLSTAQSIPMGQRSTDNLASVPGVGAGYRMSGQWSTDNLASTPRVGAGYGMSGHTNKSGRKKWIIGLLAIAAVIVVGVVVGVVVAKSRNNNRAASKSSSSSSSSGSSTPSPPNPNDPSDFPKNPAFFRSFYGMAYTPVGSQLPECGNSLEAVIADIQIMSQLTKRIHLYGADCNQSALVLEAIKQTNVDMTVWLANYPIATDNGTAYERQRNELQQALITYGTTHVSGIVVGNEFMLDYMDDNNIPDDPNSPPANVGAEILVSYIQDTRSMLKGMNLSTMPVGTSEAGAYLNNIVMGVCDFGMANVHPWFGNVSINDAANWTYEFFEETDVAVSNALSNKPTMYIAETGWPTQATNGTSNSDGPSIASVANLQIFLDTYLCQANANGTGYFFFEFADEEWKNIMFGGVEGWWGLFNQNLTLKDGITIPNCPSP